MVTGLCACWLLHVYPQTAHLPPNAKSACPFASGINFPTRNATPGAELYSVAMLLAGRGLLEGSTLLGTGCQAGAIAQAQLGWFDSPRLQSLDEGLRQIYFVPEQRGWQVWMRCGKQRSGSRAMLLPALRLGSLPGT